MENIFGYLDGIENVIQQLVINPTEDNIKIVQAIINTAKRAKAELNDIQKHMAEEAANKEPIEEKTE